MGERSVQGEQPWGVMEGVRKRAGPCRFPSQREAPCPWQGRRIEKQMQSREPGFQCPHLVLLLRSCTPILGRCSLNWFGRRIACRDRCLVRMSYGELRTCAAFVQCMAELYRLRQELSSWSGASKPPIRMSLVILRNSGLLFLWWTENTCNNVSIKFWVYMVRSIWKMKSIDDRS